MFLRKMFVSQYGISQNDEKTSRNNRGWFAPACCGERGRLVTKSTVYKAPVFVAANWTGAYVGVNGGYGWGNSSQRSTVLPVPDDEDEEEPTDGDYKVTGGFAGGTLGYNWQVNNWLLGVEGDYAWSGIKGSTVCGAGTECGTKIHSFGTVRGRVGFTQGNFLVYGTGGWAVADVNAYDLLDPASGSKWRNGWAAGGGVEYKISGAWSAKLEYLYMDFGTKSHFTNSGRTPEDIKLNTNLVRVGINYAFGVK